MTGAPVAAAAFTANLGIERRLYNESEDLAKRYTQQIIREEEFVESWNLL